MRKGALADLPRYWGRRRVWILWEQGSIAIWRRGMLARFWTTWSIVDNNTHA